MGGRGVHLSLVACRLKFSHFVGSRLKFSIFVGWAIPLFFLRLPSNAFLDIGSVGRIEKKKKTKKKNHKKSRNNWPWYPRTTLKVNIRIFGLTKCTIYCEKCSSFCSCFSLCCYYIPCSFFRLKESFQVKNGVTTSFLFFFKCQKFGSVG